MNKMRKRLLIDLEKIVGNEFYNAHIQNWGPGGVFEGEGRAIRYPITFIDRDRGALKTKNVEDKLPSDTILTGSYKLGANELSIMRALDRVLSYLERHHGLQISVQKK
jgi:hypothetical protein